MLNDNPNPPAMLGRPEEFVMGVLRKKPLMKNLVSILEAAGAKPKNTVKTLCFLTDINDFAAFNKVYERYFTEKPARSCVGIQALPKGAICEVEVIAAL